MRNAFAFCRAVACLNPPSSFHTMPFINDFCWFELSGTHSRAQTRTPAIFLDRDGVIIEEKHYLCDPCGVEIIRGVPRKLEELRASGLPIIVVTNQSGIGQGLFGWDDYDAVHRRMIELIGISRPFAAVYANGHGPRETGAPWRKPNPGMLLQAAADLNLDMGASVMVGDKLVDLQAAAGAGIGRLVHVASGHGRSEREKVIACFGNAELVNSLADFRLKTTIEDGSFNL